MATPTLEQLVLDLVNPGTRETALLELSKKRESFPELAPYLWHSFGTMMALLQEIISIYPSLSPPSLTAQSSNRVCNALALLQCVASHGDTRSSFLAGILRSVLIAHVSIWEDCRTSLNVFLWDFHWLPFCRQGKLLLFQKFH